MLPSTKKWPPKNDAKMSSYKNVVFPANVSKQFYVSLTSRISSIPSETKVFLEVSYFEAILKHLPLITFTKTKIVKIKNAPG